MSFGIVVREALRRGTRICFVARALGPQIVKRERFSDSVFALSREPAFCISRCQFARNPFGVYGLPWRLQSKVASKCRTELLESLDDRAQLRRPLDDDSLRSLDDFSVAGMTALRLADPKTIPRESAASATAGEIALALTRDRSEVHCTLKHR